MYSPAPKGLGGSVPPHFGTKQKPREPRDCMNFPWRTDPDGRVFLIYLALQVDLKFPQHKSHRVFGGEKEGSLAWFNTLIMKDRLPRLFSDVGMHCSPPCFAGVVHRVYERQNKFTVYKKLGASTDNEHFNGWKRNKATAAEIARAERLLGCTTWHQ